MKPIKSPIQARMGSPLFLVKLAADLLKVHKDFIGKVEEFIVESRAFKAERERIIELPKGEKGDSPTEEELISLIKPLIPAPIKGDPGDKGEPGADAVVKLEPIIEEAAKRVVARINTLEIAELATALIIKPKDGETPAMDTIVEAVLAELKIDEKFKGMRTEMASYRNQLAGKVYGKDTWARGSGTTVSAGANITLVPRPDGTVQINASGGGSGTNVITQYQLTAVQSGDDVTIDLTQLDNYATFAGLIAVYRNNIMQTETLNFTFANPILTVKNASADDDVFNTTYAYA